MQTIEIVTAINGGDNGHPRTIRSDERFDRGERIILVDSVRWGRTFVTYHGVHGTRTHFRQEGSSENIIDNPSARHPSDLVVRSARERGSKTFINGQYRLPDGWKNTEELVLDKVKELVKTGRLRNPQFVHAENKARREQFAKAQEEGKAREDAEFKRRAEQAHREGDVNAIIAAMRWAQSQ